MPVFVDPDDAARIKWRVLLTMAVREGGVEGALERVRQDAIRDGADPDVLVAWAKSFMLDNGIAERDGT